MRMCCSALRREPTKRNHERCFFVYEVIVSTTYSKEGRAMLMSRLDDNELISPHNLDAEMSVLGAMPTVYRMKARG